MSLPFYFVMPIAIFLFLVMFWFGKPPFGFVFFWLAFFMYGGLMIADRLIELDKYQPPEKLPDPLTTIGREQRGSANVTML